MSHGKKLLRESRLWTPYSAVNRALVITLLSAGRSGLQVDLPVVLSAVLLSKSAIAMVVTYKRCQQVIPATVGLLCQKFGSKCRVLSVSRVSPIRQRSHSRSKYRHTIEKTRAIIRRRAQLLHSLSPIRALIRICLGN